MVEIGSVGGELIGVAIAPDGMRAYVVGTARYEVSAIDISTNAVVATMGGVGDGRGGVAMSPDGALAYSVYEK